VNQPLVNAFQAVRFLADAFELVDLNKSPLQQPYGLSFARITRCVGTFRFRMKFVFRYNVTVDFYTRGLA
jgi:hypothetical protein